MYPVPVDENVNVLGGGCAPRPQGLRPRYAAAKPDGKVCRPTCPKRAGSSAVKGHEGAKRPPIGALDSAPPLARRSLLLFLGEAGGAGGNAPCIDLRQPRTSEVGLGGTIGRRKRAVDALASTVPFFGVADELPRGGLSRGTWNTADRQSGRGYAVKAL